MPTSVGPAAEAPEKAGEVVVTPIDVVVEAVAVVEPAALVELTLGLAVAAVPSAEVQIETLDERAELN